MLAVFWRTIKDRKYTILAYFLAAVLFLWMYVSLFPFIQEQAEELKKALDVYPESFMQAFGIENQQLLFEKLDNFLAAEYYSFIWPIMVIALLISLGGYSIAGEVEKGTMETLLAQPISRVKLFFEKYLAGLFIFIIFVIVSVFAVVPLAEAYNIDYQFNHYITVAILGFMFGLAIFSIASLLSAIFSEKGKAYFITAGIIIVMYVLNIMATLKESLADLKYFSFFYYYDYSKALFDNQIDDLAFWVFLGVSVVCTALAVFWFSKRDISVP